VHIHVGALDAFKVFLYVIIIGFFWRIIAGKMSDNPIGQAMAFLY
jgi:hypothetical protein